MVRAHGQSQGAVLLTAALVLATGCREAEVARERPSPSVRPDFVIRDNQTHNKFSRRIAPVVRVPSGSVIEAFAHEATGGQFTRSSTDPTAINMDLVHTLTGPVYVEGAEPGDVLAVELLEIASGDWGWMAIIPHFGALVEDFPTTTMMRTFAVDTVRRTVNFAEGIRVPLRPFPGVMGVAPDTEEMLETGPPRANGGNMDNPHLVVGTTVYFPIFVPGALFSIGDPHAAQGLGEVAGTGMESPMRFVFRISVLKNRPKMQEVQYESAAYYATTAFASTLDEAAKKATRYMVEHLVQTKGLSREDAYLLCSLAGDLQIAEMVDTPHMLVAMHLPKSIFARAP
jgi:acetamidase/formamidase